MAPPHKGKRAEEKVRIPAPLQKQLAELTALHGSSKNEEMVNAIAEHIGRHDPAKCPNVWCAARRDR